MQTSHKNKTIATLLAALLGAAGIHRFYLRGVADRWGWLHLASLPACGIAMAATPGANPYFWYLPLTLSLLAAFIEALVLGLIPDDKWDAQYNAASGRRSASRWPLAVVLVATLMVGAGTLIAALARMSDLLYTGGAYG